MTLPDDLVSRLRDVDLEPRYVEDLVRAAIEEDLAGGADVTSDAAVVADAVGTAQVVTRVGGVLAGVLIAETAFMCLDPDADVRRLRDGALMGEGDVVLSVTGSIKSLLTVERTALNLLCHLSGIATLTRHWVNAVAGSDTVIRDTRSTTPLLRPLEQYAVRCGGGINHRTSLADSILVSKNHVLAAGGVAAAVKSVKAKAGERPTEIEVDSLDAALEAVESGAELLLLDGMSPDEVRECVKRVEGKVKIAVGGPLSLSNALAYAEAGVDQLAVAGLTRSARALDISMVLAEVR